MPYKDPEKAKLHARLRMRKRRLNKDTQESDRLNRRRRYSENSHKEKAYHAEYKTSNPDRYRARYILNNAIRNGIIRKTPCEKCGTTIRVTGHHNDYSKPLDVNWLCHRCHMANDKKIPISLDCPMARELPQLLI